MKRSLFFFFSALFFCLTLVPVPDAYAQSTTGNALIPYNDLALILEPLTAEELDIEAKGWQTLVKEQIALTSHYLIETRKNSDSKTIQNRLAKMREKSNALVDRFSLVLNELEQKGGDAKSYRAYIAGLPLLNVDTSDVSSFTPAVTAWLTSKEGGIKWLKRSGVFIGVIIIFWILAGLIHRVARHALETKEMASELIGDFILSIVKRVVMLVGLITALAAVGVKVGAMLALMGGGAFILAFAMQETLGNLASGVMLLINHPFGVGDAVEVAGVSGKVQGVRLMTTEIRTFDNKLILIPNNKIWGDTITNATGTDKRRVDLVFGIGYDDDVDRAATILKSLVDRHPKIIADPPPTVRMNELGDFAVNFICRPWAKTEDYWDVYWDMIRQVKDAFELNGITMPYPTSDVHYLEAPKQSVKKKRSDPILLPVPHQEDPDPEPQTEEGKYQKLEINHPD